MHRVWKFYSPESSYTSLRHYSDAFWKGHAVSYSLDEVSFTHFLLSNTYINAFPYEKFKKYAKLENLVLRLWIKSEEKYRILLEVFAVDGHGNAMRVYGGLYSVFDDPSEIVLDLTGSLPDNTLYVYFRLGYAEEKDSKPRIYLNLKESGFYTKKADLKKVNLAIVMPTYKREKYVLQNIDRLVKSGLNNRIKVVIVDNGRSLKDYLKEVPQNIYIIPNPNVGGAGGFTRGVLFATEELKDITHLLFADDDIQLEPYSIERVLDFLSLSGNAVGIGGTMLKLSQPYIIHESSAIYRLYPLPHLILNKHKLNILAEENLHTILSQAEYNHYGWWFYAVPVEIFFKHGLPLPFFFRGDDMEFNIRLKLHEREFKIIDLNGCYSIHEDFEAKADTLTDYLIARNELIMRSIHFDLPVTYELKFFWQRLLSSIFSYRYERANCIIEAYEDFLKGPEVITSPAPETKIKEIRTKCPNERTVENPLERYGIEIGTAKFETQIPDSYSHRIWKIIILGIFTHLIPPYRTDAKNIKVKPVLIEDLHSHRFGAILKYSAVLYYNRDFDRGYLVVKDTFKFIATIFRAIFLSLKFIIRFRAVRKRYRKEFKNMKSREFWHKYISESHEKHDR